MDTTFNEEQSKPIDDEFLYSFSVSSDELRELKFISYFLATNIKLSLSEGKDKDTKFKIDIQEYTNIGLMGKTISHTEHSKKNIYGLGDNPMFRKFKYNDKEFSFNSIRLNNKAYGAEGKLFYIINIRYNNITDLEYFLKHSLKYYHIHYCNTNDTDDDYIIYSNDEQYWERIGSRKKRDLKYIYLPKKQKKNVIDDLETFLKPSVKERYIKCGISYKRIYLFEGIPGSGKTSLITALASNNGYNVALLSLDPKTTDLKLNKAIKNLPDKCVLVIEDIDGLFVERRDGDNKKNCVTMSGLLNAFDGIGTPEGLIVFITTNYKSNLDSALIRPGRVDYVYRFDYIKTPQIKEMYRIFMENKFDETEMDEFISEYKSLNVNISASLLQQYLFKYFDNPKAAIENINDIKTIKTSVITRTNANEDNDLYS
jgi:hypothetical protein